MRIQISEQNVKIKTLENICEQLEKSNDEKEQIIQKAKDYVKAKEEELKAKDEEIDKRDDFIAKVKMYMENKQKEFNDLLKSTSEGSDVKNQLREKERMLTEYIDENHRMEKQIDDMERCINGLKDKLMES